MTTEINKIIIEQNLYGMTDSPLYGEDYLIEAISRYIDNTAPSFKMCEVLTESIQYSDSFSLYLPLLEAVDNIKLAETELEKASKEKNEEEKAEITLKSASWVKKAVDWWFKIDPDKKCKNAKLIIKLIFSLGVIVLRWRLGGGASAGAMLSKIGKSKIGSHTPGVKNLAKAGDAKLFNKYGDIANSDTFKKELPLKNIFTKKKLTINLLNMCIDILFLGLSKLEKEIYYKYNLTDLDANISKLDKLVDQFNEAIDEETNEELITELKKGKKNTENALRDLLLVKEEKTRRDNNKELRNDLKEIIRGNK